MSDSATKADKPEETAEPTKPGTEASKPQPPAQEETDWKAEARKWEQRAKDNKTAADRLAELEQEQMSESEKAQARIKAAEDRAAELEVTNDRKGVAIDYRLSAEDAELLEDVSDLEAMRRLAGRLAQQERENAAPRPPKPNPAQRAGDAPVEDKDAIARAFFGIQT